MTRYRGESCDKCGKQIELELEDHTKLVPRPHDCIVHLKEEIDDLHSKIDNLITEINEVRYLADPDDRRYH